MRCSLWSVAVEGDFLGDFLSLSRAVVFLSKMQVAASCRGVSSEWHFVPLTERPVRGEKCQGGGQVGLGSRSPSPVFSAASGVDSPHD